ncbi:sigma-70 family RNA polymerase sigma factor [Nocardioides sp. MAH-18]|uniref:Sigma-70 family RNA polymerase sigma factor n=1 Tax=Nocardioides agri TaxID=2682843 RepID=A0A6L6XNF5_9ACTN|nr:MULTISPECIES: sigma-70 family RNA polymerase sigma factor [unclassified Nocardioides]MBA2953755.1 sigma-70 family RNA polymerase sigma factor [Nocardioides sp. CGMCC 1.13656]MVQ48620.1 sigma-70 family RNA polymerase sigma factor [Nocardioides sp. MAH-18]
MVRPPAEPTSPGLDDGPDRTGAGPAPRPVAEPFDAFYRREFPRLLVLARALVGSAFAEDVAQEALMVAYRRWHTIADLRSPAGYVRGICLHKATSMARRRTLERQLLGRILPRTELAADDLPEDSARFWEEVRRLPRRQAQTVALHYALDMPVAEIAEVLSCAEGTVKVHLHRARTALAASLDVGKGDPS